MPLHRAWNCRATHHCLKQLVSIGQRAKSEFQNDAPTVKNYIIQNLTNAHRRIRNKWEVDIGTACCAPPPRFAENVSCDLYVLAAKCQHLDHSIASNLNEHGQMLHSSFKLKFHIFGPEPFQPTFPHKKTPKFL